MSEQTLNVIAQILSILGLIIIVISFQCKKNRNFFLLQGTGSFVFFLNFILIGAYGGAFFNLVNLLRGLLFAKNANKRWKLILVEAAYVACFAFSIYLDHSEKQIILVALPFVALFVMSVFMWLGNPKHMRYFQIAFMSPSWIVHNIFNLSIGGILCESFNIVSSIIYLIRMKRGQLSEKEK